MALYDATGNLVSTPNHLSDDTSPEIEHEGKALSKTNANLIDKANYGVTRFYPIQQVKGYDSLHIVMYLDTSDTTYDGHVFLYANGNFTEYWTMTKNGRLERDINGYDVPINSLRFDLPLDGLDGSYAYIKETGYVVFAGKDTEYYGKTNINGKSDYGDLSSDYIAQLKSAYSALVTETDGNYNRIPFLAYTDQHDTFDKALPVFNAIDNFCDWNKFSKVFNLGDCIENNYTIMQQINKIIPVEKQINVLGNHDMEHLNPLADHTPKMKYFPCGGDARRYGINEWWVIRDDARNVKYITINDFEMPVGEAAQYWYMSTAQIEWLVTELEKADGYDVILLAHCHLDDSQSFKRDGTTDSGESYYLPWMKPAEQNTAFHNLIAARKQKTSGTYTDRDGNTVPYNFSNCDSELLIMLSGHKHTETYKNLPNSICNYIFECFYGADKAYGVGAPRTIYFGYIDRAAHKFKNWKLYDGITEEDVQEIDIN